jgi:GT2 family glycosyltransferase
MIKSKHPIFIVISTFITGCKTIDSLHNFYRINKKPIELLRSSDEGQYQELLDLFGEHKQRLLLGS